MYTLPFEIKRSFVSRTVFAIAAGVVSFSTGAALNGLFGSKGLPFADYVKAETACRTMTAQPERDVCIESWLAQRSTFLAMR